MNVIEWVRPSTMSPILALRLAIGQASEALVLLLETGHIDERDKAALRRAGQLLRPTDEALYRFGSSMGDSADHLDFITAARDALRPDSMDTLVAGLQSVADDLEQLASGERVSKERIHELEQVLGKIRRSLAASHAKVSDDSRLPAHGSV